VVVAKLPLSVRGGEAVATATVVGGLGVATATVTTVSSGASFSSPAQPARISALTTAAMARLLDDTVGLPDGLTGRGTTLLG
jgi:hypothetical protein